MRAEAHLTDVLRWLAGPIIWAAHLLIVYASESILCTRGGGADGHFILVLLASAAALAGLLAIVIRGWRGQPARATENLNGSAFMDKAAIMLGMLSLIAVLWSAVPALVISACSPAA